MLETFEIFTIVITSLWMVRRFNVLHHSSRYTIAVLLYVFYIVPLILDYAYQFVDYWKEGWGFQISTKDSLTRVIYDITIMYTLFIVLYKKNTATFTAYSRETSFDKQYKILLLLGALIPPVAVLLLLRQPSMLFLFQWRELGLFSTAGSYSTIEKYTYIAVSCSVFLLFDRKTKLLNFYRLIAIPLLATNICIQGKRAILFFMFINIMIILYLRFKDILLKGRRVLIYLFVVLGFIITSIYFMLEMTFVVKAERGYNINDTDAMYTATRIDFFRDDRIRLAIYKELYPEGKPMLDYRGQTLLTDALSVVPINYMVYAIGHERYSYQTYLTCALENYNRGEKIDVSQHGYMTVCFLAELISNFNIIGILLIPFVCLWFCKKIDQYPYPYNALIICAFTLINLFDFTYVVYYLELLFIICYLYKRKYLRKYENIANRSTT